MTEETDKNLVGQIADYIPIVGEVINYFSQQKTNRENRRFARQMYGQQSADAIAQWNRSNAYNTPSAQMARFRDAGLNPNLVYGMENLSAPTQTLGTPNGVQGVAPRINGQIGTENRLLDSQIGLLQSQKTNVDADTDKKLAEIKNVEESTKKIVTETQGLMKDLVQKDLNIKITSENLKILQGQSEDLIKSIGIQNKSLEMQMEKWLFDCTLALWAQYTTDEVSLSLINKNMSDVATGNKMRSYYTFLMEGDPVKASTLGQQLDNEFKEKYGDLEHIRGLISGKTGHSPLGYILTMPFNMTIGLGKQGLSGSQWSPFIGAK